MKREGNYWVFESGRRRYGYSERLSIDFNDNGDPHIEYGSDGSFWSGFEYDGDPKLTRDDLLELANHQVAQWKRFIECVQLRTTDV